jgi:alanine racemase
MTPQSYYRCWVEVDLDAIRQNVALIRQRIAPGTKIMAVVKADAYGHGLAQAAGILMQAGVDAFAVANLTEALALRQVGGPGWPILLLGSALPFELEKIVEQNITATISTLDEARALNAAAGSRRVPVHIEVDTGMGRVGFWHEEIPEALRQIRALPQLKIEALYTHFPSADDNFEVSRRQLAAFLKVADRRYLLHAANSAALLNLPESHLDMVRPGLLLYGIAPGFRPALAFKARVSYVKAVAAGRTISYGQTFIANRSMKVATISAGYADGFSRSLSNNAQVLIAGRRCPVIGRVTMDQLMVDVTGLENIQTGDEVVFIGRQGGEEISATEVAGWENTIAWEVLCGITKTARVPRIYRGASAA